MDRRKRILAEAPCKLNLHLRAGRRRKDGYHEIESVFQLISVYDSLSVEETGVPGSCTVVCPDMPLPPDNTVARAVSAFRKKTGAGAGVEIRLQSRQEAMFGSTIRSCAESCLEELGVENALVEIQDYGCLDFAIRARLNTAVRRARRYEHG